MLLPLLLALTSAPSDEPWATVGNWSIYENDDNCAALTVYNDDTVLRVAYTRSTNRVDVSVADPAFKSIEQGKEYKLKIVFNRPTYFDEGWGEKTAMGMVVQDMHAFVFVGLNAADFIKDMNMNETIGFFKGDTLVDSLSLKGSRDAMAAMERCAVALQKKRPIDPFKE